LLLAGDLILKIEDAVFPLIEPVTILHECPFGQTCYPGLASTR
jgi:hypothetical protein